MADVKIGYINTILIKDLSRLGRNYLEVGNLAEVFLPEHGCELISLNEKLDDMMVFRNWFNEQHSKSTSLKVRAGKRVSAQNGRHTGAYAPYGYKKDPQNRHKLLVDDITAPIVRRIFQMRASGVAFRAIAVKLNEDNIISPREYYYQESGSKNPRKSTKLWSDTTVKDILKNEVYLGLIVSGKSGTISYKNQKQVRKDSEDWIRAQGTHEPLVDKETWDRIQALAAKNHRPRRRNDGETNLFTSILFCADCGFRLKGQVERRPRKDGSIYKNVSYMCTTFAKCGKNACSCHGISENTLTELVVEHIKSNAVNVALDEERIAGTIISRRGEDNFSYRATYENERANHITQIEKLDALIENLYADRVSGVVPESLFKRQIVKYEQERNERNRAIKDLDKRLRAAKPIEESTNTWVKLMKQYADINKLTLNPTALITLIDRIIVNEAQYIDGKRVCDIKIVYNYVGYIDELSTAAQPLSERAV
jgi:DNA invertase Pin-like site-specific DNA recombinase